MNVENHDKVDRTRRRIRASNATTDTPTAPLRKEGDVLQGAPPMGVPDQDIIAQLARSGPKLRAPMTSNPFGNGPQPSSLPPHVAGLESTPRGAAPRPTASPLQTPGLQTNEGRPYNWPLYVYGYDQIGPPTRSRR